MLSKKYKLKKSSEISQVFRKGKTVKSSFLFLRYSHKKAPELKVAFSIGINYSKRAVDRNKAKRILRLVFDDLKCLLKPGLDLVFYLDKNFKNELELEETKKAMLSCFSLGKLLK